MILNHVRNDELLQTSDNQLIHNQFKKATMAIVKGNKVIKRVSGLSVTQENRIYDFLQGSIYCWVKNREDEWFSLRDLMGGLNFDWQGTPMYNLYKKHLTRGYSIDESIKKAGIDAGWILKNVIANDIRNFETKKLNLIRCYRWIK